MKEKATINKEYTNKQFAIIKCVDTYNLNK